MGEEGDPGEPARRADERRSASDDGEVSVDGLFRMLADERRRRVLRYLLERPRTTLEELSDVVLGWQASAGGVVGPDVRENVVVSLHHSHLPLLEEAGLVEYDRETGAVRLPSHPEHVRETIRRSRRDERGGERDDPD